jgi:hypothetical protein
MATEISAKRANESECRQQSPLATLPELRSESGFRQRRRLTAKAAILP